MALPVTLSCESSRLTPLPMIFQSFGSLSLTSAGGSILAAASATLPKVVVRPDGLWVMTLFDALHSAAGTFHSLAAAWLNDSGATAPPLRTNPFDDPIPRPPAA